MTNFEKGGLKQILCSRHGKICWSLHALWDAEILKLMDHRLDIDLKTNGLRINVFDVESWSIKLHNLICTLYYYPKYFTIEQYIDKYGNLSKLLVYLAAFNVARIINERQNDIP